MLNQSCLPALVNVVPHPPSRGIDGACLVELLFTFALGAEHFPVFGHTDVFRLVVGCP